MSDSEKNFSREYKNLNPAQKEAVDTIDGPVMVVAGPGTGKTQILALRIGNILLKTDIKADGILCLTFTNSAVDAMRERLIRYIGEEGGKVNIFTFHSFGMKVIEEHYKVLGFPSAPKLLDDTDAAILFHAILNENQWEYLRPRGDSMRYFSDLRSLISLLKRERIATEDFSVAVEKEINSIERNENNISSRGESKGQLKREAQKQIEGLERSTEIVKFIDLYEKTKKEKNVLDYDDVLESLVAIMEISEDAVSSMRERYLYVLIDEHQDSSRVQNEFLKKVWSEVEAANIFVVGDDRQLIYGFSGASIDHFQGFKKTFSSAKLILLVDNYRSTQVILDASHALLQSVMSSEKLISQNSEHHPIRLVEASTGEDEIVCAGIDIKEKIQKGLNPNDCAILVPKNKQVRKALEILSNQGLPISKLEALNLFDQNGSISFLRVLKIITSNDVVSFAGSFFDEISGIQPLEAHKFIAGENMRKFSFETITSRASTLFSADNQIEKWMGKLTKWKKDAKDNDPKSTIEIIGKELFVNEIRETGERKLVSGHEILDTVLGLLEKELEKNSKMTLAEFVSFLEKLKSFGTDVPLTSLSKEGIKVLTMHSSKGLEFDYIWIAHMDQKSLDLGKRGGFTLPEAIKERIEERDIDAVKRKLYVAITRAKRFCTLSYATQSQKGSEQELARLIADLPPEIFSRHKVEDPRPTTVGRKNYSPELVKLVSKKYTDRYVSTSLLNNFFECPWKWYFRNLLQLPEPTNENLEFGIAVHDAIDKILKLKKVPTPKDLEQFTDGDGEVLKVVSFWVNARLKDINTERQSEQSVSIVDEKFPHLNIYGKIDLIEKISKDNVRVTDFKTGGVRKKSDIEKKDEEGRLSSHLRQLAMYSYLLTKSPKWKVDVSESRLEFVEAKKEIETFYNTIISEEQIDMVRKDITDYDELVKTGEWVNRSCHYNSYGKNTECEYCKMAEIYKKV